MTGCTLTPLVDRHFAGRIRPDDERRLRQHLPECQACGDRYRRRLLLARIDPAAEPAADRLARGLGLRPRRRSAVLLPAALAACVAAAGVALFLTAGTVPAFAPRGPTASRLLIYRIPSGGTPVPAVGELRRQDELAFAYENPRGRRFLLIYGVDDTGRVYWFHPAWPAGAPPAASIPISTDGGVHELPEAIGHDYAGGELTIHAVFSDVPLSVAEVDTWAAAHRDARLPGADPADQALQSMRIIQ